ncbi:ATP-binding protein [Halioxenophilus sp. WMMB6]|uniref:ATP-binding protein n=1 Tax=Halioxenophilus sp. WMMB6 TaxID=3073815 RepID=UPI00295F4A50|nr:ATP-binding protein [Halioxenophilus sp. WMMB6]
MTFDLSTVTLVLVIYVTMIFGVAIITNRGWIPDAIVNNPIIYILSLGVFASTWAYYGIVDLAFQYGYSALTYYIGTAALFVFAPVTLTPIAQLVRRFKIPSVADLLVFRYHSQAVGSLVTLCMLVSLLPLLAMQIQAVSESLAILTLNSKSFAKLTSYNISFEMMVAMVYCLLLCVFCLLFGATRDRHRGLVMAMAMESLIKVCALMAIGLVALFQVFGGLSGLDQWLLDNPNQHQLLYESLNDSSAHTLLLVFIATSLALPHIFQSSVVEVPLARSMRIVSWAFPLFLLFMALPIFPILWAGFELSVPLPVQYYTLGVPLLLDSPWLTLLALVGGLSAATGAMVSITLASSVMVLNHWLLPLSRLGSQRDLRRRLVWLRQATICAIFGVGFLFYLLVGGQHSLMELALVTFIETLQFFPAIISVTYWSRANRIGLIAGLSVGSAIWFLLLFLPMMLNINQLAVPYWGVITVGIDGWNNITLCSLGLNMVAFIVVSLLTQQNAEEQYSASLCTENELTHPVRVILDVHSCEEIKERLSKSLGATLAEIQVNRAVEELGFSLSERRPYCLRRIRNRLETNLSSMMGRSVANELVDRHLPYRLPDQTSNTDINLIESRLHRYRDRLSGMAAELDNLRLYHRNTLQELPLAICSLGRDLEVIMWNRAMEALTGIESATIAGSHLSDLPTPWRELITAFSQGDEAHRQSVLVRVQGRECYFSLHKSTLHSPTSTGEDDGQVILLEDITELKHLEHELAHSERLASIGRLAAGVAHEIGNPVTGIACLAQNLKYEVDSPDALESAQQILSQTDRISRIVHSLVSFSHAGNHGGDSFHPVALYDCVAEAVSLLSLQKDNIQVDYCNLVGPSVQVFADDQKLIQVFVNLLSNARDASQDGDKVLIEAHEQDTEVEIWVTDQGSGIDKAHLDQIVEPFFTTKEPGKGTGLGLAMVYSIIDQHQGTIRVESPINKESQTGTRFIISLPTGLEFLQADDLQAGTAD